MKEYNTASKSSHFTVRVTLVGIGLKVQAMGILCPISERVKIAQKTIKYTPTEKLVDALITILSGAKGLVEANKRVRPDRAIQSAFGRQGCAEQSVISDTLNACTVENVSQMEEAFQMIHQQHSVAYRHNYEAGLQVLDIDMTGMPCGKKAAFASKGYFAKQRNRRGRQLGRVLATNYQEIVIDQLYDGKTQLAVAFQPLVSKAEAILGLDEAKRRRTLLRMDSHGGSQDDVNWALHRGYQVHTKDYSGDRARKLAASVQEWHHDPKVPGRQLAWVTIPATEYVRPVRRIAVRSPKKNGQWGIGMIISTLTPQEATLLARMPCHRWQDPLSILLAYVYCHDLRSGGVETQFKGDKQGLGIHKRNKKRFEAQQMLIHLNALAHNLIIWSRHWLAPTCKPLKRYGILRMVRDVFQVRGQVFFQKDGRICRIQLDHADPLANGLSLALASLLEPLHVAVNLGQI